MSDSRPNQILILTFLAALLSATTAKAADTNAVEAAVESITLDDLKQHVNVLASATSEGREAPTRAGGALRGLKSKSRYR